MIIEWHKLDVGPLSGLEELKMISVTVADKKIGILKKNGALFAFSAICPHAGAHLCDGRIDALGKIVCPLHHYRFDPLNGRNTSGEGYKLKTFPIESREDNIYVGIIA